MKFIRLLLLVLTFIFLCKSGRIIPDPNYPVLWKFASQEKDSNILELKFKLPTRTKVTDFGEAPNDLLQSDGLLYNQYLAVRFQTGIFDFSSATTVVARLFSSTTEYKVSFKSSQTAKIVSSSQSAESNVCYVLFEDIVNQKVPANESLTLRLTFNTSSNTHPLLSTSNPQTSTYIHNLGIFTSTSNNPDGVIIDNLPSFGNVSVYVDYKRPDNRFLKFIGADGTGNSGGRIQIVSPSSTSNNSSPNTTLYPGFTINIIVVVEFLSPWYLDPEDVIYYLKFDTKTFDYPTSLSTENNSSDINGLALTESLTLTEVSDGIIVNGLTSKNTYPGRKIRLLLNGVKTKENSTLGTSKSIELLVLYKSTYSVISYDNTNIGSVNQITLESTASYHPDRFDIYDGMGWPFVFEFKSPYEIQTGGFVVIRQGSFTNTMSLAFVASSCDFSETNLEQSFGKRWNCYPLRNDFKYDTTGVTDEGSGFYFKLPTIGTDKYKIKIWAFAERCLGTVVADWYRTKYSFMIRIFKNTVINNTVLNEKIFFDSALNYLLAKSSLITSSSYCYPLLSRNNAGDAATPPFSDNLHKIKSDAGTGLAIGLEINNMVIGAIPTDTTKLIDFDKSGGTKRVTNVSAAVTPSTTLFTYKYLFSSTDIASTNLLIFSVVPLGPQTITASVMDAQKLSDYIPSECSIAGLYATWTTPSVRWVFSKEYVVAGTTFAPLSSTTGCQLNWVYVRNNATLGGTLKMPLTATESKISDNAKYIKGTMVSQTVTTTISGLTGGPGDLSENIDTGRSVIDNSTTSINRYQLTSKNINVANLNTANNHELSMINGVCATTFGGSFDIVDYTHLYINFGFYTDCLKWNTIPSTTKWIFSYFDMHQIWLEASEYNARVVRFIKLYPELDFSQNPAATEGTVSVLTDPVSEKWISNHYRLTTQSSTPYSVCLLEINSKIISTSKGPNSNTLVMFLFATSLLDVDISDSSSEYPIASSGQTAYGLNSGQTISLRNRRVGDTSAGVYPSFDAAYNYAELEFYFLKYVLFFDYTESTTVDTKSDQAQHFSPGLVHQRTMYQFLLGSLIVIPSFTPDITKNLFVPYLCPSAGISSTTTLSDNGIYFVNPIVSLTWLQMSSYHNISNFDAYVIPKTQGKILESFSNNDIVLNGILVNPLDAKTPIMTLALLTPRDDVIGASLDYKTTNFRYNTTIDSRQVVFEELKVNFLSYSNTINSKTLELKKLTNTGKASAIYMFLNSDVSAPDATVSLYPNVDTDKDLTFKKYNMNGKIYILGKPFNKFLAWGNEQKNGVMTTNYDLGNPAASEISVFELEANQTIRITGIPRLNILKYSSETYSNINHLDYIAVFTSRNICDPLATTDFKSAANSIYKQMSNLRFNDSGTFLSFVLWLPDIDKDTEWRSYLSIEDYDNYLNSNEDSANILLTGQFPITLPKNSDFVFVITSSNTSLNSSSKCGIEENGLKNIVTECKISSSTVTCTLSKPSNTYKICCYNLTFDNSQITISSGQIELKTNSNTFPISTATNFSEILYSRPKNTSLANFANAKFAGNSIDLSVETNFSARITDLDYMISNTNGGYGVGRFRIVLPRSPTRGMKLTISGSFSSSLKIPNLRTRVVPTFGNSLLYNSHPDVGDVFLDSTYTDFGDTTGIVVLLKNMVYKCGLKLSKHLNIYLYPIKTTNLNNFQVSVSMVSASGSTSMANVVPHKITSQPKFHLNLVETLTDSTLCSLTKVEPTLPSMYAEYTFTLNFVSTSSKIELTEGLSLNEVLILFDHIYFGNMPEVVCTNGTTYLQCNWIFNSILSIRYPSLPTATDSNPIIKVIGIYNPHIPQSVNNVYYGCAVSQSNFIDYRRIAVQGFTQHTKYLQPETESIYGNIVFKNSLIQTSIHIPNTTSSGQIQDGSAQGQNELNPREKPSNLNGAYISKYSFAFTLDKSNNSLGSISLNYTFGPNIECYVTFPKEFTLHKYALSNITIEMKSYVLDNNNKEIVLETQSSSLVSTNYKLTISNIVLVGNQLRFAISPQSLILVEKFQYFTIDIFNIPPPEENTTDTQAGTYTTSRFDILMFSKNSSGDKFQVFRTWRNLNNWSKIDILTGKVDDFLVQNKGLKFEFDQKKWIFDIYEKESNNLNNASIEVGRFKTLFLRSRNISKLLNPISIRVTINDEKVSLLKSDYYASPFLFSDSKFEIGLPCEELVGNRVVNPVFVNDKSETGINIYDYVMPLAFLNLKVTHYEKEIIWFQQYNTVRIAGSTFVDFRIINPSLVDINIQFVNGSESMIENCTIKAKTNSCRTVFKLTDSDTILTQAYNLPQAPNCFEFKYDKIVFEISDIAAVIPNNGINKSHFEYENYLTNPSDILPNSINFKYNSVYSQVYIYAVLVCINDDFPTNEQLISRNITESNNLKFYSEVLNNVGNTDISFKNVARGVTYKVKIIAQSTQGKVTDRTQSVIEFYNYTFKNLTTIDIMAPVSIAPRCAQYRFNTIPGDQVTNPLLWYWQRQFTSVGFYEGGCVLALDQYGTPIPGLPNMLKENFCNSEKCKFVKKENYTDSLVGLVLTKTYTICAYPYVMCEYDPLNYDEIFNGIITKLSTNQTFNETLNTRVVPEFKLVETNDNLVPEKPTISMVSSVNKVTVSASSLKAQRCILKLSLSSTPTVSELDRCSTNDCKVAQTSSTVTTYEFVNLSKGTYKLYGVCYNDMHCSVRNTGIIEFQSITISSPDPVNSGNDTTISSSAVVSEVSSNSSFLSLSLMTILFYMLSLLL